MYANENSYFNPIIISKTGPHSILYTEGLNIGYKKKQLEMNIATNINISIGKGELVAVLGVNGVGKSTLLRTLSGIQPALSGKVFIQNKERENISPQELSTLISLVLTQQPISQNLSVQELIALGRQPYTNWLGNLSDLDREQVRRAIELVEIKDLSDKKCFELSDGQLQKILIARALAQDTPLMILDEPTSHLDMYHKAQVLKLLKDLCNRTGKSILFASHEINLALQLCDSLVLMKKDGVQQGTPEELIEGKAFESVFPTDLIVFDPGTRSFRIRT